MYFSMFNVVEKYFMWYIEMGQDICLCVSLVT